MDDLLRNQQSNNEERGEGSPVPWSHRPGPVLASQLRLATQSGDFSNGSVVEREREREREKERDNRGKGKRTRGGKRECNKTM